GPLLAQLLGTALVEETVFHGWLWPQSVAWLRRAVPAPVAAVAGLLGSQALFALLHLPALLAAGAGTEAIAGSLLMLFVVGLVFVLVYAATGNLFIAIGAHALGNAPTLLFAPQGPAPTLVLLAGVLAVAAIGAGWRRRARRRTRTF